ncbi:molybdate ABC transporter substrate-binding protein [Streptomyces griseoloalbus]|uniref:Molybdate transport system substrate-binding protein n=1 Tax=Streptomyces griseoloalbus TaxID=67303 RepID=A0A7W8BMF4_9ACTN|nr:molybdate ABC transporter substrate-binding protein [Streptomyces albaduncus]MBB5125562.1 molybdate transport system substrate-binding protein [Streptomyces albaduncus]GGW26868.1 molybdate-binding protein [Streptomyces albaduncus]
MTRSAHRTRRSRRIAGAVAVLALSACSAPGPDSSPGSATDGPTGTVTVFAAASLRESFTTLGERFEEEHPGTEVTFSFGGSDALAAGIDNGAPADVFAAASPKTMELVTDRGHAAGSPSTFVRNRLQIATVPGNPHGIDSLEDLTAPGLKVVLCDRTVPCGAAAQTALGAARIALTPASYEQDVKGALTKVELKEADAAVVYRTDVKAAGDKVEGVEFRESAEAVNDYPIALLDNAPNPSAAKAFVALVKSPEGRKVLGEAGFLRP